MSSQKYDQLARSVLEEIDDNTRGIVRYRDDEYELVCKREDVDTTAFKRRVMLTVKQARNRDRLVDAGNLGVNTNAHVEFFDGLVAVHLREDSSSGVVVVFEMQAAEGLSSFIDQCRSVLKGERDERAQQSTAFGD